MSASTTPPDGSARPPVEKQQDQTIITRAEEDASEQQEGNCGCEVSPRLRSYILEWVLTCIVIVVPLAVAVLFIPFRVRSVSLLDPNIQQPYIPGDSIAIWVVLVVSGVVPITLFALYPFVIAKYSRLAGLPKHAHTWHYMYWWTSCLIQTVAMTVLLSELSKRLIQMPRPDFLDRCFPGGLPEDIRLKAVANNYILHTDQCQPTSNSVFEDGFMSMPSEHTSISWCMMTILILFFSTLRHELLHESSLRNLANLRGRRTPELHAPHLAQLTGVAASPVGDDSSPPVIVAPVPIRKAAPSVGGGAGQPPMHPPTATSHAVPSPALARNVPGHAIVPRQVLGGSPSHPTARTQAVLVSVVPFWPSSHVVAILHTLFPIGWAVSVSLSRAFDHKHSYIDIILGALLGIGVAFAVFRLHLTKFRRYHQRWQEDWPVEDPETGFMRQGTLRRMASYASMSQQSRQRTNIYPRSSPYPNTQEDLEQIKLAAALPERDLANEKPHHIAPGTASNSFSNGHSLDEPVRITFVDDKVA